MRRREFPASYPLLGLLGFGPTTGYDLRKLAEATLAAFWHEGFAQVYASLAYFEAEGLAVAEEVSEGRRRKVYTITDAGQQAFQAWLEKPVVRPQFGRHELLVKVFFGRRLSPAVLGKHLEDYRRLQEAQRAGLESLAQRLAMDQAGSPDLPYWLGTVDHGVCLGRALEDWCVRTRERTGV